MQSRVVQKALAGKQDILFGQGSVTQTRNGAAHTIDKINADNIPYSGDLVTEDVVTIKEKIDNIPTNPINYPHKNAIINGNFDIWQRASSSSDGGYCSADRWSFTNTTGNNEQIAFPLSQTDVPNNPKYHARMNVSGSSSRQLLQRIEGVQTFAGQEVTLSYYAKGSVALTPDFAVYQDYGTGGSPSTAVSTTVTANVPITTAWQKITHTFIMPSISGTLGTDQNDFLQVYWTFFDDSDYAFDIAQVQLELGDLATNFELRSIGQELLLCQRYHEVLYVATAYGHINYSIGRNTTSTGVVLKYQLKRTTPTLTTTGSFRIIGAASEFAHTVTSITVSTISRTQAFAIAAHSTTAPSFQYGLLSSDNDVTAKISLSAEL